MIVVSACLAGVKCRYDGQANTHETIKKLVHEGKAIMICPEILGGLSTPRKPCEINCGKVITADGEDHTQAFEKGAKLALEQALSCNCKLAILKAKSPSCGCNLIYDGSFTKTLVEADGMTAELFKKHGIIVVNETVDIDTILKQI